MRENQFSDPDLGHLLNVQLIFDFLLISESFKNLLIFILNVQPTRTLGRLFEELEGWTKETGEAKKIVNRLDIDLRNSLAHFMFKEVDDRIYYYEHIKGGSEWTLRENSLKPSDLLDKIYEQSLMRAIFFHTITDWYGLT